LNNILNFEFILQIINTLMNCTLRAKCCLIGVFHKIIIVFNVQQVKKKIVIIIQIRDNDWQLN